MQFVRDGTFWFFGLQDGADEACDDGRIFERMNNFFCSTRGRSFGLCNLE